jgi:membrane protease YdiL (CAAX protease family)
MTQLPPPSTAPAGWYPDPAGAGVRFFDGRSWAPNVAQSGAFEEKEAHPDLPMKAALGALVVLIVSLIASKVIVDGLIQFDWPVVIYILILASLGYGPSLWWIIYVRRRWGERSLEAVGWRFRWSDLGWGPITWISAVGTQIVVALLILALDIPLSGNVEGVGDLDADRAYIVATAVAAVVAAPIVEEAVFRGLVMRGFLSRMGPVLAVGLQGVLFGLAHVDPVRGKGNIGLALILSAVGIAFGVSAYLTRRLGPTVIAHAIFNGVVLTIVLTGVLDDVENDFGASSSPPAEVVFAEHNIVDQPDVTEPRSQEHDAV